MKITQLLEMSNKYPTGPEIDIAIRTVNDVMAKLSQGDLLGYENIKDVLFDKLDPLVPTEPNASDYFYEELGNNKTFRVLNQRVYKKHGVDVWEHLYGEG